MLTARQFWRTVLLVGLLGSVFLLVILQRSAVTDISLDLTSHVPDSVIEFLDADRFNSGWTASTQLVQEWPFPKKIWQTDKSFNGDAEKSRLMDSWREKNPTFRYELLNDYGAEDYVQEAFRDLPKFKDAYFNTTDVILRSDMLRLLLMYGSGGVYSDTDTECLVPIDEWVPKEYWGRASLVVGFETERSRDVNATQEERSEVKVCQWTLLSMAKNKHVAHIMGHIVENLHSLADQKGVKFEELGQHLDVPGVIWATGPAEVTLALQVSLSKSLGKTIDPSDLRGHLEPFLLDDVLFLPVNAFAGHQHHSHSGEEELGPLLVKHYYGSSWWKDHGVTDEPADGVEEEEEQQEEKTSNFEA